MINSPKEDPRETVGYGRHLITSVQHSFDNLFTYQNSFTAIPAESTLPEYTNPYFIKKTQNQLGLVSDNVDPEKLGRVRVSFWWMEGKQQSQWIKVTTPYTAKNGGFYFVPPINSRVLVGFEGGNVEKPYCIGELFDKDAHPDPAWAGNYNDYNAKIHAIRTRSGHTIEFHDTEGEEKITIYDKGDKNRITLDSANGQLSIHADGKLKFNADKIELKAKSRIDLTSEDVIAIDADSWIGVLGKQKGIFLKSEKDIQLKAQNELRIISTTSDVKIESSIGNISCTALSEFKISNATSSINMSMPMVEIKGPIIKIN